MSINAFLAYLQFEKKYSIHTVVAYKNDIYSFRQFCIDQFEVENIETINYSQIRNWIVSLVTSKISNRTINRKITSLKTYYKFLQKIKVIDVNPLVKHKALRTDKKLQVPFSEKEIIAALQVEEIGTGFETVRNKLILELFYATGIRRSELINIKLSDIDDVNETLKVVGKRNKERYIPLIKPIQKSLKNYLKYRVQINSEIPYLFVTEKGKKTYDNLVYRIINSYFSTVSSKVKKSPHILRHTFATHLLNQGADLNSVKELLGHSSLASTQVYTHNSLGKLKEIYNQTHPRSQKKETNMKVIVQPVNFNADKKLIDFIEKKVTGLEKFYDKIVGSEVFLKVQQTSEKENKQVDIKLSIPGNDLVAKKQCKTFEEGVMLSVDSLKRQLAKKKEKVVGK